MIELPRAALIADKIAEGAQFFSFGTNDLTQTTYGLSRDDAGNFLVPYQELGVIPNDPFVTLDQEGVGELVADRMREGPQDPPGHQARHLRRARRRSGIGPLLPRGRAELRFVLALSGADRPAGGGARGDGGWDHQTTA